MRVVLLKYTSIYIYIFIYWHAESAGVAPYCSTVLKLYLRYDTALGSGASEIEGWLIHILI